MFDFSLENGSHTSTYFNEDNEIKFNPPVYEQRYCTVMRIIEHETFKGHIKKIVDFGCAEMRLLSLLKRIPSIEHILQFEKSSKVNSTKWSRPGSLKGSRTKKVMEDSFDFDLRLLGQNQCEIVGPPDADFSYRKLARRIASTNSLINICNTIKNENECLKKQLLDLNKSANEVQTMYQKDKLRANGLIIANERYLKQAEAAEKEILNLRAEIDQKALYYYQLEERLKQYLETEKMRSNNLILQNIELNLEPIPGKQVLYTQPLNKSSNLNIGFQRDSLQSITAKNRDSNRSSRMVSRGTQYQFSTTTRSTCTSAFIKKHNVAVNFPEVVSIAIEDIFNEVLVDIPNMLSPIQEIAQVCCNVAVQTEDIHKNSVSVGICTDLHNVRNELELKSSVLPGCNKKLDLNAYFPSEKVQPQLSELWELLGQTIFALIGSSEIGSNSEDVGYQIETLKRRFSESYGLIPYYNSISLAKFPADNLLKKEINHPLSSSPDFENIKTCHSAVDNKSKQADSSKHYYSNESIIKHSSHGIQGVKLKEQLKFQEKPLNDSNSHVSKIIMNLEHDVELAAVNDEIEKMERKMLVISPIQDNIHTLGTDKSNVNFGNLETKPTKTSTTCLRFEENNKDISALKFAINNSSKLNKHRIRSNSGTIHRKSTYGVHAYIPGKLVGRTTTKKGLSLPRREKECKLFDDDYLSNVTNIPREVHSQIIEKNALQPEIQVEIGSQFENMATTKGECYLFGTELLLCKSGQAERFPNMHIFSNEHNNGPTDTTSLRSDDEDFYGFTTEDVLNTGDNKETAHTICVTPASPEPIEQQTCLSIMKTIPLERLEIRSDYSPASPPYEKVDPLQKPKEIPIECKNNYNQCVLSRFLSKYSVSKHRLCLTKNLIASPKEGRQLWLLRKIIERYLIGSDEKAHCLKCAKRILKCTQDIQKICSAICEVVEDTDEQISNEFTPPATVMTRSHFKIMVLIKSLDIYLNGIEDKLIFFLDQRIFNMKADKVEQKPLINLFLLYLGLIDVQKSNTHPARLILYKSLYYYKKMSVPMVYYVLVSYPDLLPGKDETYYDDPDPLVDTIQSILNNQHYEMEEIQLKHREVFHILRLFYKYERIKPSKEEVVEKLLFNLRLNKLQNVSASFALLCKRNGFKWSTNFVLDQKLIPLLIEYANQLTHSNYHDEKVACILDSISSILKTFPDASDISLYRRLFINSLYATNRQIVQESAVLAILRTCRFGYEDCFKVLYRWNPPYQISRLLQLSIKTFIHRKPLRKLKFWERQINFS